MEGTPVPLVIYSDEGERVVVGEAWITDPLEGVVAKFFPGFEIYGGLPGSFSQELSIGIEPGEAAVVPKPPPPVNPECKCIENFGNVTGFTYTAGCPEHDAKGH